MRRPSWVLAWVLALLACLGQPAWADAPLEPAGRWLTQDGEGVIEIAPCGQGLCGRVIGIESPLGDDGKPLTDPEGRARCGLTILHESREARAGLWSGIITNPDDGANWRCEFWMVDGTLHIRGYALVPLLGRTQTWTRYQGTLGPDCGME